MLTEQQQYKEQMAVDIVYWPINHWYIFIISITSSDSWSLVRVFIFDLGIKLKKTPTKTAADIGREEDADLRKTGGQNVQTTGCGIYHVQNKGEKNREKGEEESEWSNAWSVASGQLRNA